MPTQTSVEAPASPPRSSGPAVLLAVLSGLFLLWTAISAVLNFAIIASLFAMGQAGLALLSLAGAVLGIAGNAGILVGAILSLREEPSGAVVVRRTAVGMLLYTLGASALSAAWLFRADTPPALSIHNPAAVGGLIGGAVTSLLWWGLAWGLSRRL